MSKNISTNQLHVLSILSGGEKYGLEIIKAMKEVGATMHLGSLYNLLNSLEKNGFIDAVSKEATAERNYNKRRYYKITALGEQKFDEVRISLQANWANLKLV